MVDSIRRRYQLVLEGSVIAEAASLTWVSGVAPDDALSRIGAPGPYEPRSIEEVDQILSTPVEQSGEPIGVVADRVDDEWTLLVEPNGFRCTYGDRLGALSVGTRAINVFWNAMALSDVAVVRDGQLLARTRDVGGFLADGDQPPELGLADVDGTETSAIAELLRDFATVRNHRWQAVAFGWVERTTRCRLPQGWLDRAHPSVASFVRRSIRP